MVAPSSNVVIIAEVRVGRNAETALSAKAPWQRAENVYRGGHDLDVPSLWVFRFKPLRSSCTWRRGRFRFLDPSSREEPSRGAAGASLAPAPEFLRCQSSIVQLPKNMPFIM